MANRQVRALQRELRSTAKERDEVIASHRAKMDGRITQSEYNRYEEKIAKARYVYGNKINKIQQEIRILSD